jgi:hypothetical protein
MPDLVFSTDDPSKFIPADVFTLEAAMLAPEEPGLQKLLKLGDLIAEQVWGYDEEALVWLRDHANVKERFQDGVIAGMAIIRCTSGIDPSLSSAVRGIVDRYRLAKHLEPKFRRQTESSFFNSKTGVWRRYRHVSHLWAAVLHRHMELGESAPFPCSMPDMPRLLGLSEGYLTLGAMTKAPKATSAVLDADVAVRPSVAMRFLLPTVIPAFSIRAA